MGYKPTCVSGLVLKVDLWYFYDTTFIRKWYHKGNHMNKRIAKEVIKEFQEWELPEALPREIDVLS